MLNRFKTFNNIKKEASPEEIERQFEMTRNDYLRDMNRVRRKYKNKFLKLASAYGIACL